eukprot:jgi/Tetstr1/425168/TSEL_015629.t1
MVNARMLKELQSLAPWTWDKKCETHPPGSKSLHDFERVEHYQQMTRWPKPPPPKSSKKSKAGPSKPTAEHPLDVAAVSVTPLRPGEAGRLPPPPTPFSTTTTDSASPPSEAPVSVARSFHPAITPGVSMVTPHTAQVIPTGRSIKASLMPRKLSLGGSTVAAKRKPASPMQKAEGGPATAPPPEVVSKKARHETEAPAPAAPAVTAPAKPAPTEASATGAKAREAPRSRVVDSAAAPKGAQPGAPGMGGPRDKAVAADEGRKPASKPEIARVAAFQQFKPPRAAGTPGEGLSGKPQAAASPPSTEQSMSAPHKPSHASTCSKPTQERRASPGAMPSERTPKSTSAASPAGGKSLRELAPGITPPTTGSNAVVTSVAAKPATGHPVAESKPLKAKNLAVAPAKKVAQIVAAPPGVAAAVPAEYTTTVSMEGVVAPGSSVAGAAPPTAHSTEPATVTLEQRSTAVNPPAARGDLIVKPVAADTPAPERSAAENRPPKAKQPGLSPAGASVPARAHVQKKAIVAAPVKGTKVSSAVVKAPMATPEAALPAPNSSKPAGDALAQPRPALAALPAVESNAAISNAKPATAKRARERSGSENRPTKAKRSKSGPAPAGKVAVAAVRKEASAMPAPMGSLLAALAEEPAPRQTPCLPMHRSILPIGGMRRPLGDITNAVNNPNAETRQESSLLAALAEVPDKAGAILSPAGQRTWGFGTTMQGAFSILRHMDSRAGWKY